MLPTLWKNDPLFPVLNLRTGIDRLFSDLFTETPRGKNDKDVFVPAMDIRETDEALVIETEIPGMNPKDISVQAEDGVLVIRGERKWEKDEKTKTYHRIERSWGKFERSLTLPSSADPERIDASYKDGVLQVMIPKKASAKPKAVQVKVK